MNDVSVLLNLTGKLVFETTNPLMDLVSGHGPYLYYDQLSLERFPLDQEEQDAHVQKLLAALRNLLSSRRLSADDAGGNIRIMVTLDLVGGFGHPKGQELCFPAQKAWRFIEMVNHVFERESQLLSRLCYTFLFMEWDSDDSRKAAFYRTLACDGCFGQPEEWLSAELITADEAREQMFEHLDSPSAELTLDAVGISRQYSVFQQQLNALVTRVAEMMERAGVGQQFRDAVAASQAELKTIGDVRTFGYNHQIKAAVSQLVGLNSTQLDGCTFFIFKMRTGTITHRKTDEIVLASLLQLLGSMRESWPARLSVVDGSMNEHAIDGEALSQLRQSVLALLPKLKEGGEMRWKVNDHVTYQVYSEINSKSTESTAHYEHNEEVDERRNSLADEFERLRRVPFFFGRTPNDWQWFDNVTAILDEIYAYEVEHDRPRYSSPGRITEKEMNVAPDTKSYADLEVIRKKLEASNTVPKSGKESGQPSGNLLTDLKAYLKGREKEMAEFEKYRDELKTLMVRLGFASITYRLSVVWTLLITLCYALHFVYTGLYGDSKWAVACLAAVGLLCAVAAVTAQRHFKSAIREVYIKIDGCLGHIAEQKQHYFSNINNRVSVQNKADIRRRNLEEVKAKLDLFKSHNMQVDLWEKHFSNLEAKLADSQQLTAPATPQSQRENSQQPIANSPWPARDAAVLNLGMTPCLPESVCKKFRSMSVTLSTGQRYEQLTCFLRELTVTFINN